MYGVHIRTASASAVHPQSHHFGLVLSVLPPVTSLTPPLSDVSDWPQANGTNSNYAITSNSMQMADPRPEVFN